LTFSRKKQPGDNDRQKAEDDEIIPFEGISDDGCGNLDRFRRGMTDRHL
jgi:hypothetical protein